MLLLPSLFLSCQFIHPNSNSKQEARLILGERRQLPCSRPTAVWVGTSSLRGLGSWFSSCGHWKSLKGNITACTHSQQESLTSADDLGTRGGKVQFCVSASILEAGNDFYGVCRACCTLHTRCWALTGKLFLVHSCLADICKTGTPKRHIVLVLTLRKGALGVGDKLWWASSGRRCFPTCLGRAGPHMEDQCSQECQVSSYK